LYRKLVNGNETAPFAVYYPPSSFSWTATHIVKILIQGNKFTTYMDGTPVLVGTDTTYTTGGSVGLRIWDSTQVCFDNFDIAPIP
jgi:hypothetical protein